MRLLMVSTLIWTTGEILLAINSGAYLASQTPWNFRGRFQAFREFVWSAGRILSSMAYLTLSPAIHLDIPFSSSSILFRSSESPCALRWSHP
jgi:hypothetical protein